MIGSNGTCTRQCNQRRSPTVSIRKKEALLAGSGWLCVQGWLFQDQHIFYADLSATGIFMLLAPDTLVPPATFTFAST